MILKSSNYNNEKKIETKWSERSTLVHPKLYVRSFVPQIISARVIIKGKRVNTVNRGAGYGLEKPCGYHFEGDNFRAIG